MNENVDKTIMVIEDEISLINVIVEKLKKAGMNPLQFLTAEQALDYIKSTPQPANAIWLDHHLPGLSGLEFVKAVKQIKNWKGVPIIAVSNSADEATIKEMQKLGISEYILKAEHRLEEIVERFKNL